MTGRIFDIQRFSVHDGPGIRTTVFLADCNLRCFWCHNPEAQEHRLQYVQAKCIGCGKCNEVCPNNCHIRNESVHIIERQKCVRCGECEAVCWAGALSLTARIVDSEDVIKEVLLDKPFYKNDGGMTVSGGEPMLQPDFTLELLRSARAAGVGTAVDTAGCVPFSSFEAVLPYTDLFLYDLKCMDEAMHRRVTGESNILILENLVALSKAGARLIIRIPVIPGVNDTTKDMDAASRFLEPLDGITLVELLTYHKLGGSKYETLGMKYSAGDIDPPSHDKIKEMSVCFSKPVKIS